MTPPRVLDRAEITVQVDEAATFVTVTYWGLTIDSTPCRLKQTLRLNNSFWSNSTNAVKGILLAASRRL